MTTKKNRLPYTDSTPPPKTGVVPSQRAAAKALGITTMTLRAWKAEGAPGFDADGNIDLAKLVPWVQSRKAEQGGTVEMKGRKTLEEIRKLKLANDQKEGRLIERGWMAERLQRTAGELNQFRTKSESEHPMRFAAANGDVAICRTIVRGIWDEIFSQIQSLKKHFEENV